MPIAISVHQVSFLYGNTTVLHDVSFEVKKGEFVGIIGPNGGGKTTLLRLLMGLIYPQKGEIKLFGLPPKNNWPSISYVPQSLKYDPLFPICCLEVVLMGLSHQLTWYGSYPPHAKKKALDALDQMGMASVANQKFGSLSTGQAQRVLIARALISNPKLLLLDEPTACVDIQSEHMIQSLLKKLSKEVTILMVTHDLPTIIHNVQKVLTIHGHVSILQPDNVCDHFSIGLYHGFPKQGVE